MSTLIQQYEKSLPVWIKADGFEWPPLLAQHHNGEIIMASMMIPGETIFEVVMKKFMVDLTIKEIIFGIDCYTMPRQGTKYEDVLSVYWWQGERVNEHYGWKFGVVNYRPPPRTRIEPIDWNNRFWNNVMLGVVEDYHRRMIQTIADKAAEPGGEELIERLKQSVIEARERAQRGQKPH